MTISASQRSCFIFRVLQAQQRVTIFLKLCQMRLTRWDLDGRSCVKLPQMGLQQWQVNAKGWPPCFATKCVKAEVKLLNSTVSSTKRPSVQRKPSSELVSDLYMELKSFCTLVSLYESQLTNCKCDHFPTLLERTT